MIFHETLPRSVEIFSTRDQINLSACVGAEYLFRQIQMIEERYQDKVFGAGSDRNLETNLFSGHHHGSGLCVCPALSEWIAVAMRGEATIFKERRKAREERNFAKPKP